MAQFMKPYEGPTYALMRIIVGLLFFAHGTSKVLGFPAPAPEQAPFFVIWIAGGLECIGGGLIAVGLWTRWAAFISAGLMAAAYWLAHGTNSFFPINNGGELAVLYCFVFLYISARGSGPWALEATAEPLSDPSGRAM